MTHNPPPHRQHKKGCHLEPTTDPAPAEIAPAIPTPAPATPAPAAPPPEPAQTVVSVSSEHSSGDQFYARAFGLTATLGLAWVFYQIIAPLLGPMVWALFLAFLLHPLHLQLERRLKGRTSLSAGLLTLGVFAVIVGPLAALGAAFVAQTGDVLQWVQEAMRKQAVQSTQGFAEWPMLQSVLEWMRESLGVQTTQIQAWVADAAQYLPGWLAGLGGKIFLGAVNTALALVVMHFLLFFIVRDGPQFVFLVRDLIPMPPKRREQLIAHLSAVTHAVVLGSGLTALVQGTLVGVAFGVTGLSSPLVFGVLAALLALFPVGGTALVWIPGLLVLAAREHWGMAIVMLVFGVLSSSVDNVLRPLLISGRADVGVVTVFIGVLGGVAAFGLVGLFLGPVVLALIIALMQFAQEYRRAS